jgi:hypothetical protein
MTAPDQPGWYDDPDDSNAQRYWDGQNWTPHRQRKNTTPIKRQPAAPVGPAPPPQMPPPPPAASAQMPPPPPGPTGGPSPWEQVRPYLNTARDGGRRFWAHQPRQRKIIWAVAGAVVLVGAVIIFATAGPLSTSGGGGSAVDTSSQSYRMGLATGTNGQAAIHAYGGFNIATNQYEKVSPQEACEGEFNTDNAAADVPLSKTDYMAGCLYGIDHNENSTNASHAPAATVVPPSKKGPNGSTIPNRPGS